MAYTILTTVISNITSISATSGGNTIVGTGTISSRGICWNTAGNPTTASSTSSISGNSTANYSRNLTSLTAGTTYYVRAYVTDGSGTYYGNQISFTTPSITTTAATSITTNTAVSGGTFTGVLGVVTNCGVCWDISTNPDPDINDSKTTDVTVGGSFISNITGLLPNTAYKIRCYINTNLGVSYGDVKTFTTSATIPTVTTNTTATATSTSITAGGNVTSAGGGTVTSRGIQRSLYPDMSSSTNTTTSGTTGAFTLTIPSLTAGTTYYLRAFAINGTGTAYGDIISVATQGGPVVQTISPYSITNSTAVTGCDVLSNGGAAITARGICYSSTQTLPSISNSTVVNDLYPAQTEPFITLLQNLTPDTTYYVRAFATNSVSTLYGEVKIFSTSNCYPYVDECALNEIPPVKDDFNICPFIIPLNCIKGDLSQSGTSCDNVPLNPDNQDLLSELIKINNTLCTLTSKDFIIFVLGSIINNPILSNQFCQSYHTYECTGY